MLISCNQCSTTYTLDDAVIPEAGAQVQCTRCGNVFTARRGGPADAAPAPAPSRPRPPPSAPKPAAGAGSRTMIFGGDAPKPAGPSGAGSKTMIFGGDAPKPAAPSGVGSKTMIFGGDAPKPAGAPTAAAAHAAANKTMIFGGDGPKPAAPGGAGSRTMIFGGPPPGLGPDAPAPADPPSGATNRTMIFGGAPPVAAPAESKPAQVGSKTMIFGGPPGTTPDSPASARPPAAPGGAGSRTMIFGGAPVLAPEPKKPESKPAPAAPAAAATNRTMIFGGAPPVAAPPEEPKSAPANRTMIFGGAPPGPEPKSKPRAGTQTMVFGAAPPLDPPPQGTPSGRTMQFGPPGQAPVTDDSGQVVFGADEARDHPSALTEGTVRIDQAELERMRREHDGEAATPAAGTEEVRPASPARRDKTQLFAMGDAPAPAADEPEQKPRHDKTQLFGGGEKAEKPEGPAKHQKTQLFAMGAGPTPEPPNEFEDLLNNLTESPGPERERSAPTDPALSKLEDLHPPSVQVDASIVDTLEPDRPPPPPVAPRPGGRRKPTFEARATQPPELLSTTLPSNEALPLSARDSAPLELPPELEAAPMFEQSPGSAGGAAAPKAAAGGSGRKVALIIAAVALALALALAWAVVGRQLYGKLTGAEVPIEALQTTQRVLAQLRGDEPAQRAEAAGKARALLGQYPRMLEAHAALVTALALELDEVQDQGRRLAASIAGHQARMKKLDEGKPADWERDRALLAEELKGLEAEQKPLADAQAATSDALLAAMTQLGNLVKAEPNAPPQAVQAVHRASGLFYAVHGDPRAADAVAEWTRAGGQPEHDPWAQLAVPMFELNQKARAPLKLASAREALREIASREPDLSRAVVLLARASLDLNELDDADAAVEKVLALRKGHAVATGLKRRIEHARLEAGSSGAAEGPPPAPAPQ